MSPVQNPAHPEQLAADSLPHTPTFDIARQPSSIWARQGSACKRTRSSPGCYRQHSYSPGTSTTPKHLKPFVARTLVSQYFWAALAWKKGRVVGWPGGASQAGGSVVEAQRPPCLPRDSSYRPALPAHSYTALPPPPPATFRPVTRVPHPQATPPGLMEAP